MMWIAKNLKTGVEYKLTDADKTEYDNNPHTRGKFSYRKDKDAPKPEAPKGVAKDEKK
jgi:hypothetical protein